MNAVENLGQISIVSVPNPWPPTPRTADAIYFLAVLYLVTRINKITVNTRNLQ